MKILFDYQVFYLQKYGGISNYFYHLSLGLRKNYDNVKETFQFFITKIYEKNHNIEGVKTILPEKTELDDEEVSLNCGKCLIS